MPSTMRAAVVGSLGSPLSIEEVPVPVPGPGEVLVRIVATGVCHTDLHAAHGNWPVKPSPPFIPGHEGAGVVAAQGSGVTGPIFEVVLKRITIRGSIVGTRRDLAEALAFAAEGKVKAHIHEAKLDDINRILANLKAGNVDGRMVVTL